MHAIVQTTKSLIKLSIHPSTKLFAVLPNGATIFYFHLDMTLFVVQTAKVT